MIHVYVGVPIPRYFFVMVIYRIIISLQVLWSFLFFQVCRYLEKRMRKEDANMLNDLIVRAEKPADYKNTELMAMRSFWNKYGPAADEHFLIRIIRESED